MGNQNTSGIVEDEKATDEASDRAVGVSSPPKHLIEKSKTLIQENAAETDSADRISPAEKLVSANEAFEDHNVSLECSDDGIDISTNDSSSDGRSKLSHEVQDQPCTLKDIQDHNKMETLEVGSNGDGEKNKDDDMASADMPSVEEALLEVVAHEGALHKEDDHPKEELSNSSHTVNAASSIGLLVSFTAENEQHECSDLDHEEEKPMMHELVDTDTNNTSCDDQYQPSDLEINQFLIRCSSDPTDMIKSEFKENRDHFLDDGEPTDLNMLEKSLHWERKPSPTKNDHETDTETTENCVVELQHSLEIDTHHLPSKTAVAGTPPNLPGSQYSGGSESKPTLDSNPIFIGPQVEIRKSPSFDFGISFNTKSEESDQTPLLYQDRTARRSLSSCSNERFQNSGVQTEYVGKVLQFEAVQLQEKTIRMERSNSESSQTLNHKVQEDFISSVKRETQNNSLNKSPSRYAEPAISPEGNSNRKPRSSLFTTCICCTAAIS